MAELIFHKEKNLFVLWILFVAMVFSYAIYYNQFLMALIPFAIPFGLWIGSDYKKLLYLFFITVPFSIEYNFTSSLGTDLPSEPLMWLMFGTSLVIFSSKLGTANFKKYSNPITFLLVAHLCCFLISTVLSEIFVQSFKQVLAKLWYVIPFYFFAIHVIKDTKELRKLFGLGIFFLTISVIIVLVKHYQMDFEFDKINKAVAPLFRNHVNYACIIVLLVPYLWALLVTQKSNFLKQFYLAVLLIFIVAIYFSYTRAAIIALILCIPIYLTVKARLVKPILIALSFFTLVGVAFLLYENNYLMFTPDYNKTITHTDFDNLVTATTKGEDISTMERVYRWVAGVQMIKDKPVFGFGPGSFYTFYKGYTVSSFQTYVSDNPDHSTVHNYYLLTWIEQGIVGFIIFILLCFSVLVIGENVYHSTKTKEDKVMVMAAIISFVVIMLLNLINDMIETDKVGPFFFFAMAIIIIYKNKQQRMIES